VNAISKNRQERFHQIIRALRERFGPLELARFLRCTPRSIRRWLSRQHAPQLKRQRRIEWLWREAQREAAGQPRRTGKITSCKRCHLRFHRRNLAAIPANHVCRHVKRIKLKSKKPTSSPSPF